MQDESQVVRRPKASIEEVLDAVRDALDGPASLVVAFRIEPVGEGQAKIGCQTFQTDLPDDLRQPCLEVLARHLNPAPEVKQLPEADLDEINAHLQQVAEAANVDPPTLKTVSPVDDGLRGLSQPRPFVDSPVEDQ